jgi:hypothetical protein
MPVSHTGSVSLLITCMSYSSFMSFDIQLCLNIYPDLPRPITKNLLLYLNIFFELLPVHIEPLFILNLASPYKSLRSTQYIRRPLDLSTTDIFCTYMQVCMNFKSYKSRLKNEEAI